MAQPLTLLLYERLLPGGQLVNRLQDRGYRVLSITDPEEAVGTAERERPLLIMIDLEPKQSAMCGAITALKRNQTTAHIPVIALTSPGSDSVQEAARAAGAGLVVHDNAILLHLDQFLEQALQVD